METFSEHAEALTKEILEIIHSKTNDSRVGLAQCLENCIKLKDAENIGPWLTLYTQTILDLSNFQKNSLVHEDFPPGCSDRINGITELIERPFSVALKWIPDENLRDVVGCELTELLFWSKGELMYMYCCTLVESDGRLATDRSFFLQSCFAGVEALNSLLHVRDPIFVEEHSAIPEHDTTLLLQKGELCHWYLSHSSPPERTHSANFNAVEKGEYFLETFIKCVNGPLNGAGWDCSKAKQILSEMNTMKK